MGAWDIKPYDNDQAADWLGDLMDSTNLRAEWRKGIELHADADMDVVRAALWLFIQLGHIYVWPIDDYDEDLELAITAAAKLKSHPEFLEVPGLTEELHNEHATVLSRRSDDQGKV